MSTTGDASTRTRAKLDGLLEGPVPPIEDGEPRLRHWRDFAASNRLKFDLTVDGASFNLRADSTPIQLSVGEDFSDTVRQCLLQLLEIFPEDIRHAVSSTVRSTEIAGDEKIQTVYLVTREGITVNKRKAAVEKVPEEPVPSFASLKKFTPILIFALVLLVVFVGSLFVLDYADVWSSIDAKYSLRTAAKYEISGDEVSRYIEFEKKGLRQGHLEIEMRRSGEFPATAEAHRGERTRVHRGSSLAELLAFDKVVTDGRLRVEYLDHEGEILGDCEVGIRGLLEKEKITVRVPVREHPRTVRIRFSY